VVLAKWIAFAVAVLIVAVPLMADAGPKVKCPAKPQNQVRARRMAKKFFNKGGRFATKGQYTRALDSFLCSLRMKGHENTVFNVAQVSKFVKNQKVVKERLERFLEKHPGHDSTVEVEELIASIDGTPYPPPSTQPASDAEAPPPGPVEEAGAGQEQTGEDQEVQDLFGVDAEQPPTEPAGPSEPAEPADNPPVAEEGPPPMRIAGYVLLGVGGAALITSVALQGATGVAKNEALDSINYSQFTSRKDKMSNLQTGATVCWIVTGALVGTGVVLLLVDSQSQESDGGVEVELEPGVAGFSLKGRF
jgi:hypothetical protein